MLERRHFLGTALAAGAAAALGELSATPAWAERRLRLRYAPRLDFLSRELSITERLELFAEQGFDATEYNGLMNHPMAEVEAMRRDLDRLGMELGIFVANPKGWNEAGLVREEQRPAFLDQIRQAIEYHRVVGNRFATVITGPEEPGVPRGVQRQRVIEGLRAAAELLEPTRLTIVIEPLNHLVDHAGYFLVTSDEAASIMAAVGSPHVKILFDIYHQQISEGNLINNIRRYYEHIGYFQVGDVPGRNEPGTGEVNWRNVFEAIHELGYQGILGMEHGLSVPGREGLMKCFEEYRKADRF